MRVSERLLVQQVDDGLVLVDHHQCEAVVAMTDVANLANRLQLAYLNGDQMLAVAGEPTDVFVHRVDFAITAYALGYFTGATRAYGAVARHLQGGG